MLFDSFATGFNQVFGFFEAQTGDCADFLDHVDLGRASRFQDDVEFGLLFSSSRAGICRAGHHDRATGCGLNAVFVFEDSFQFLCFQQREVHDLLCKCFKISHCDFFPYLNVFQRRDFNPTMIP